LVVQIESHGPREVLWVAPFGGAGIDEDVRHALGIDVLVDRRIGWRTQRAGEQQDLILFHQSTHLLYRTRWAVAVIQADEVDLAPVDATLVVDHFEIRRLGATDGPVSRSRAAVRHGVANFNFSVRGTRAVLLLRLCHPAYECKSRCQCNTHQSIHGHLLQKSTATILWAACDICTTG
jgi:hypothetical protein